MAITTRRHCPRCNSKKSIREFLYGKRVCIACTDSRPIGGLKRKYRGAHNKLHAALNRGEIAKPRLCSVCKRKKRLDAHHPDYSQPLLVVWMCHECHMRHHAKPHHK